MHYLLLGLLQTLQVIGIQTSRMHSSRGIG